MRRLVWVPIHKSPTLLDKPPATETDFEKACNEFWWVSAYVVKGICRNQLVYATDHLYGICQQELLRVLAWQVASDKGTVDIGKNYSISLTIYPLEKEKEFSDLLDFSSVETLFSLCTLQWNFSYQEAQSLAQKWDLTTIRKWLRRWLSMLRKEWRSLVITGKMKSEREKTHDWKSGTPHYRD